MDDNRIGLWLVLWMLVVLVIIVMRSRQRGITTGLVTAYVFDLWLIHWVAPCFYLLPWYNGADPRLVEGGLEKSLYGIAAFAIGSMFLAPFLISIGLLPRRPTGTQEPDRRLPITYVVAGVIFYMLLTTAFGSLPTARAIVATGQELIVVGVGLCCWQAWRSGNKTRLTLWIAAAFAFPLITIVTRGFIGYGAGALVCVLVFISSFVRSPIKIAVAGLVLIYLGLSVFTTYMGGRTEIRKSVWGGASLSDRVGHVTETAAAFEWFDPFNLSQLQAIDGRLNQNILVGAAITHLEEMGDYAYGDTLWDSVLALIPRVLWPDKTINAGSGTVVSQYTGIKFDNTATSVGIGAVMEFYINFGTWGVICGFLVMGTLITIIDIVAAERLASGDLHRFVLWYLPGISLLQVGGSMIEITSSAGASLIVAFVANKYLSRLQKNQAALAAADLSAAGEWSGQSANA